MIKYAKLAIQNTELLIAFILQIGLTVFGLRVYLRPGDDIGPNWQDALIALYVTFATYILFEVIKIYRLFRRYKSYEGSYKGYGYVLDEPSKKNGPGYDELKPDPLSKAVVKYVGGSDFTLELSNHADGKVTHTWKGSLTMTSDNMADIGYRYTNWPDGSNLMHSAGYKRAVICKDDGVSIYMFSNDGQRFGREVLIKATSD
jgi:hypothetical protein